MECSLIFRQTVKSEVEAFVGFVDEVNGGYDGLSRVGVPDSAVPAGYVGLDVSLRWCGWEQDAINQNGAVISDICG